jgi:hypothetical protein
MGALEDDPAGEIAGLISSDWADENIHDELTAMSLRVSSTRLAVIDAMSKKAGVSRNRMANMLLAAGCKDVMSRLPQEVFAELAEDIQDQEGL